MPSVHADQAQASLHPCRLCPISAASSQRLPVSHDLLTQRRAVAHMSVCTQVAVMASGDWPSPTRRLDEYDPGHCKLPAPKEVPKAAISRMGFCCCDWRASGGLARRAQCLATTLWIFPRSFIKLTIMMALSTTLTKHTAHVRTLDM